MSASGSYTPTASLQTPSGKTFKTESSTQPTKVTLVVLNYLTPELTLRTVRQTIVGQRSAGIELAVIVVDNSPTHSRVAGDPLAWLVTNGLATLITTPSNLGFSGGVNLAAKSGRDDEFIWLLNSDALPAPGALDALLKVAEQGYAIVGSQIVRPDGKVESCGGRRAVVHGLLSHRRRGQSPSTTADPRRLLTVPWVHGASMLVARNAWEMLGGFDERFFLYFEEVDLCFRAQKLKLPSAIALGSIVAHQGGASVKRANAYDLRDIYFSRNYLMFLSRHLPAPRKWVIEASWWLSVLLARTARGQHRRVGLHIRGTLAYLRKDFGSIDSL